MKSRMIVFLLFAILNECMNNSFILAIEKNTSDTKNPCQVFKDIEWARAEEMGLTMDIYVPQTGKASYPVLIIYHGGGWLINNKSIMDSMSIYIVQHSEIIVCNVNYRLMGDNSNTTTINEIIEDAFGAFLWVKTNISSYKGDPSKIAVTGDSAGGHLAAMVLLSGEKLKSGGFDGSYPGYKPTYLPEGISAEEIARKKMLIPQAAVLSYPAVDLYATCLKGFETDTNFFWIMANKPPQGFFGDSVNVHDNPEFYKVISPIYIVPYSSERMLPPQLCIVGTKDLTTTPASIQNYISILNEAGQPVEYWEYEGKNHAFLDSNPNPFLGNIFYRDAPLAIDKIIGFLNRVFE